MIKPRYPNMPIANMKLTCHYHQLSDYYGLEDYFVHRRPAAGASGTLTDDALASGAVETAEVFRGVSNSNPNLRPATNALEDGMEDRGLPQSYPYSSHPFAPKPSSTFYSPQDLSQDLYYYLPGT